MLQTSYVVRSTLPINQTLSARLWTKAGGVWRFTDQTFTALPAIARFTYPAPGATTIDSTKPFTWTTVPTAQAYYLYVGSTLGANDLLNTGELAGTSYVQTSCRRTSRSTPGCGPGPEASGATLTPRSR
jgi:hypothetical protein